MKTMKLMIDRVASEVQRARLKSGLTQQQLATVVKVTRASISNIERAKQAISLDLFCRIAEAVKLEPSILLERILQETPKIDLSKEVGDHKVRRAIEEALATK